MKKSAKKLEFICRIRKDGSGTEAIDEVHKNAIIKANEMFTINRLSLTFNTYIASGYNSFVVKLKEEK